MAPSRASQEHDIGPGNYAMKCISFSELIGSTFQGIKVETAHGDILDELFQKQKKNFNFATKPSNYEPKCKKMSSAVFWHRSAQVGRSFVTDFKVLYTSCLIFEYSTHFSSI